MMRNIVHVFGYKKQRANVPEFGNWENGGNAVPYTAYKVGSGKNKMINPNDPLENPEMLAPPTPPPKSSIEQGSVRPTPEQRPSAGSEQSFERSPLHPQNQAKIMGQGRSYDSSHGTRARSRLRPVRLDGSPEKAAVPKFGLWDDDPESSENFTHYHVFESARPQNNTGGLVNFFNPKNPSTTSSQPCDDEPKKASSCFPRWW